MTASISMKVNIDFNAELDDRSRDVFRLIVESYLEEGEPLGSRTLSKKLPMSLSPASVRNVMADLESLGLIFSPHISAGRLPTEQGLRFFVDAFMDTGEVSETERQIIESQIKRGSDASSMEKLFTDASQMLSGMSRGAGLVLSAKREGIMKHIEFIRLEENKALAVLVWDTGDVENRVLDIPPGITASQLSEAANYLNHHGRDRSLSDARRVIDERRKAVQSEVDTVSADLIERGLAVWSGSEGGQPSQLIVRGRSNLIDSAQDKDQIDRLKLLFDELERKDEIIRMLDLTEEGSGVRIFIGSENRLFSLSGSSLVVAPYRDSNRNVVGAIGIIGPTRLNYGRIVPVVDYTAQLIGKMIEKG
jgi:heat-inducible transcriptional repressor